MPPKAIIQEAWLPWRIASRGGDGWQCES